jgi:hypothetical protein
MLGIPLQVELCKKQLPGRIGSVGRGRGVGVCLEAVGVGVAVGVWVAVAVAVGVAVGVWVAVAVAVGVAVGVCVAVAVAVGVAVGVCVAVGLAVAVGVGVPPPQIPSVSALATVVEPLNPPAAIIRLLPIAPPDGNDRTTFMFAELFHVLVAGL